MWLAKLPLGGGISDVLHEKNLDVEEPSPSPS